VRRGNDDLVAAVNEFITRATEDGTFTKTFRRWMAVEQPTGWSFRPS
jgi:ABC-type amino acid transport substrate-binding protein